MRLSVKQMKYLITCLLANLLFSVNSFAASDNAPKFPSLVFKTIEQAQKYCPDVNNIKFTAGLPAPGVFAKIAYLTATFSSKKNGMIFMNSKANASCPVGTSNPQAVSTEEDRIQAKKSGNTICYLLPKPIVSKSNIVQNVEITPINGNYGSLDKGIIRCNYKYRGAKLDPETSKPIDGDVILTSQKGAERNL